MRMRHFPFEVDAAARATWLQHFEEAIDQAIADGSYPAEHRASFVDFLHSFSSWMVNVEPDLES
jgi:truncated hemoglobin YjbI